MKHFLIRVEVRDGEHEYTHFALVLARNEASADKYTTDQKVAKFFLCGKGDYRLARCKGLQEIDEEHARFIHDHCDVMYMN